MSYSASSKYSTCPRSYFLHYMMKLREIQTKSAFIFGNCVDNALNRMLKGESDSITYFCELWDRVDYMNMYFTDADLDDSLITNSQYNMLKMLSNNRIEKMKGFLYVLKKKRKTQPLTSYESRIYQTATWMSLREKGIMLLDAYREQILPHIDEVLGVQKQIKMENGTGDKFTGYIDLIAKIKIDPKATYIPEGMDGWENKIIIIDNKTSSVKYKPDSVATSGQLATYYRAMHHMEPDCAGYIVLPKRVRKRKQPRVESQVIIDNLDEEFIDGVFAEYEENCFKIKEGMFPKKTESCIGKFGRCVYYNYCHDNHNMEGLTVKKKRENANK